MSIQLKTRDEMETMRRANLVVHRVLCELREMVAPGVSTKELDERARAISEEEGVKPAFLGYPSSTGAKPFPGVICASVNEAIVHGIPNEMPLKAGDIVSVDYGCQIDGFFGDSAVTIPVGEIAAETQKLLEVTKQSLDDAILHCQVSNRLGDVSAAVQKRVEENGFNVVREFVGHGIGRAMHEPPQVPNFGDAGQGRKLKEGMVLAIEPMVTVGAYQARILDDGWTAVTADSSLSAHFEHTIAITNDGPDILSMPK